MAKQKVAGCWCNEAGEYICAECEQIDVYNRLTPQKQVFVAMWIKAEKRGDAKKSMEMHIERDKKFPGWDYTPEDVPKKIWEKY